MKQLNHAFSCASLSYRHFGKLENLECTHEDRVVFSQLCFNPQATLMLLSCSPNFLCAQ